MGVITAIFSYHGGPRDGLRRACSVGVDDDETVTIPVVTEKCVHIYRSKNLSLLLNLLRHSKPSEAFVEIFYCPDETKSMRKAKTRRPK